MSIKEIKSWNPEIEKEITEKWKNSEMFIFDKNSKKKIYSIDTPPPYVNAPIHIGQAVTYCYMDFFARYKRMKGFNVLFSLGLDRNGLPIEIATEKKFGISAFKMKRDDFISKCKELLEDASSETEDTFAKLGISFTSYKKGGHIGAVYYTDSPDYRKITQSTFIDLFRKGLVYEDTRISNWDTKLRTAIADSEIEYKDIESLFNIVKWKIKETGEEVLIGTTRPELICTCGAVLYNPEDKRYKHLKGKTVVTPLFGKEVKIMEHPLAKIDKGTGLVMMCSAGDLSDIQFFREQNLVPEIAIDKEGVMNDKSGFLKGLKVKDARQKIIEELKDNELLESQNKIVHRTPVSERTGAEIEFIEMPEFYLKQVEFKKDILKISKEIKFFPKESRKILEDWMNSVSIDWPISRRRFYATPIPLWNSEIDGTKITALGEKGNYHEPWKDEPGEDCDVFKNNEKIGKVRDFDVRWEGEERVFDTWMDSSISELVLLKYLKDDAFFKKAYPASLRPQGKEIIRTWLYYSILRGWLETGKPCFEDVWINQHIVDEDGYKMSKSKGNIIDPQKLLEEYGAEAIRLWASTEGDLSKQDMKCSKERIKGELKTVTKLINISKFVMMFDKPAKKPNLTDLDRLFIDYIEDLTEFCDTSYGNYDFYNPATRLRRFLWDKFASNYIEIVKARVYNQEKKFTDDESNSAKYTLHFLLKRLLTLLYPIIPQVTTVISKDLGLDLLKTEWPEFDVGKSDLTDIKGIMDFNSKVWKKKKEKSLGLRDEIKGVKMPSKLAIYAKDLKTAHNLV
ncbi:MAG: valine--tRNA ligase [Nanoarchaeota archaeon]|nr:valine--tRNA ligase [Nanoarchaeota archaeon]